MQNYSITRRPLKSFIAAGIATAVLLTACSLLSIASFKYLDLLYYSAMLLAVTAGLIHLKYLNRIFDIGSRGTFGACLFFTMLPVISSLLISVIVYYFLDLPFTFLTFQTGFLIPFLVYQAYVSFLDIPEGKYKVWSYPYYDQSPKTHDIDHTITELVNLVLSKDPHSPTQTSFKLDAPVNMPFGALFFNFINEYNKTNPEKEIIYADEGRRRFGWTFHRKSGWLMMKEYIDPEATFRQNDIQKDDTIYATRQIPETIESSLVEQQVANNTAHF